MCTLCDSTNINTIIELVRSTQNAFSLSFAAILVNCAPSGEMHNYCTPRIIKENFKNFLIRRCNCILISQVYCVCQVVKTPTIIFKNPVFLLDISLFLSKRRSYNGLNLYDFLIMLCEFIFYHPTHVTFSSRPFPVIRLT